MNIDHFSLLNFLNIVYMVECKPSMGFLTSVQFCIFNGLLYVENEVETILHVCGSAKRAAG